MICIFIMQFIFIFSNIQFQFKRKLLKDLTSENIIQNLIINNMNIIFKIGTPQQEIPVTIKLQHYPFYIISNQTKETQLKLFQEKLSSSFKILKHYDCFHIEDEIFVTDLSTDNMQIDKINLDNFTFFLVTELNKVKEVYETGNIGLKISFANYYTYEGISFINLLKQKNLINSYSFSLIFYKDDNGLLSIGELPHEYNKKYKKDDFNFCNAINVGSESQWAFKFDEIKYKDYNFKEDKYFWLYPELGVIISSSYFRDYLNESYFKDFISKNICFQKIYKNQIEFTEFYYIYCKSSLDTQIFSKLILYQREMNYTFEIDLKDLFYTLNDMKYFLILFPVQHSYDWKLGLPFFKKYNLYFDLDKKIIGIYKNIKTFSFNFVIFLVIILIAIIIGMGIFIYHILKKKTRKIRANELNDDFEYIAENN